MSGDLFGNLEKQYGLPANLLSSVMRQESGGNIGAVSPKGAKGPFQFMDATAKQYGVNVNDLTSSATGAAKMYADLLKQNGGDLQKALASYNWGQGNVQRQGLDAMPTETRQYIQKVTANMGQPQTAGRDDSAELFGPAKKVTAGRDDSAELFGDTKSAAPQVKPQAGASMDQEITNIPRQIGLTVRHGIQGLADTAGIVGNPIAAGLNAVGIQTKRPSEAVSGLMDWIGLPSPETARERVVGDASRMLSGGGAMVKGANVASNVATGITKNVLSSMAAHPGLQAASAIGSGTAGGLTRENGGGPGAQFVASLAGGLAAPAGVAGLQSGVNAVTNAVKSMRGTQLSPTVNININNALNASGIKLADVPKSVMASIQDDVARASQKGEISPDALRRLVDYRMIGANPARANLTLNPVDITKQKNLAKIGANSADPKLQTLAMQQYDNTGKLIGGLNALGANTADDAFAGGTRVMNALQKKAGGNKLLIDNAYDKARNTEGLSAGIDPSAFTRNADDLLTQNLLNGSLPADVRNHLNKIATGETPLNVSTAEQFKTVIGNLQRSSSDGSARKALGFVRQALDDAPLAGNQGQTAIDAFNTARGLNRNWRGLVEKTPALQAIEDGVQPDKFVQNYIIQGAGKANVMDVARLKNAIKTSPDALTAVREQILSHLKAKATSSSPDEAMKFTQSGYNNALNAIGEQKLRMFFSKSEIDQIKAIGRVALYEQVQPNGSAVNNSNTAGAMVSGIFERLANNPITNKFPFGKQFVNEPATAISAGLQGRGISNVPNALLTPKARNPAFLPLPMLLAPGISTEEVRR